jgi:broad specificity phosphatase PhoE
MVQIKMIRHSERLDFTNPFYWLMCIGQYWADSPLTKNGHDIANIKGKKMISEDFKPKYIYTSPYNRTMSTSTEIKTSFPHCEIIIEPLLAEYQPTHKHRINLYPNGIPTTFEGEETEFNYPETYENFEKRIKFIISQLINKHDTDIIIVTHGEVLKTYINYIQALYPDLMLDPGSTPYLTILSFDYDKVGMKIDEKTVRIE